ncbi:MAG: YicC/YloC family endoribonuclease [bacterium]|nr:YicC/YloC family endoribonuclease [bacterium]
MSAGKKLSKSKTHSMTGFGKGESQHKGVFVSIEIKTVNHKYLDLSIKLPRIYNELENDIRKIISSNLTRGRIDIFVTRKLVSGASVKIDLNEAVMDSYFEAASNALRKYDAWNDDTRTSLVFELLTNKEVLVGDESEDLNSEKKVLFAALDIALSKLTHMRDQEGKSLLKDAQEKASNLQILRKKVEKLSKSSAIEKGKKLKERILATGIDFSKDEIRINQEIAILADRVDVSEELVRIASHLDQLDDTFLEYPQGRKLDFVTQELFREWNTIGSKTQDPKIQSLVVEAKVEIERLREQVQNIE